MVREPEFEGVQYPSEADELGDLLDRCLHKSETSGLEGELRGLVTPFGDYEFAGRTMAAAYQAIDAAPVEPSRVLLIASSVRVPFRGLAVAGYDDWRTPLGEVPVDSGAVERAVDTEMARPIEAAFEPAAALELQLPFLQRTLEGVEIMPVLVGDAESSSVADFLEAFWTEETLLVVVANLSEGFEKSDAECRDRETIAAIEAGETDAVGRSDTSARLPIRGMMEVASEGRGRVELLDYRTSAETAGESGRVVGYAAFSVTSLLSPRDVP